MEEKSVDPRSRRLRLALVIVVPVAMFLSLASWGFASAVGSAPDDDYHMASIWCAVGDRPGLCEPGSDAVHREVPERLLRSSTCYNFRSDTSAECTLAFSDRLVNTKRGNFDHSYPPVFYSAMGIFASRNVDASLLVMRAVNAAVFVGMVTGLFFLLRPHRRPALLWGAGVALVPLGMFLIPSVNPSSWAIISAAVLWGALVGFFDEHVLWRRAALAAFAVLATVMAAGARSDAAVYSGIAVVAACAISFRRTPRFLIGLVLPLVLVVVAVLFFFASGQSSVANPGTSVNGNSAVPLGYLLQENLVRLPGLWSGALGTWALGWFDTPLPAMVWVPAIAIYAGVVVWGLRAISWRKAAAMAIVFAALVLVPMYILLHDRVLIGVDVQPRYIYPIMILLVAVAVTGIVHPDLSLNRLQLGIVVTALAVANAAALHTDIRRYTTGLDQAGANLDARIEWWWSLPVGPIWIWILGSTMFGVALVGLTVAAWTFSHTDRAAPVAVTDR